MMAEVTIGSTVYLIGRLNAFDQLKIARRIAPLAAEIMAFYAGQDIKPTLEGGKPTLPAETVSDIFRRLAMGLTCLSDEDCDEVSKMCLSVVRRKTDNGAAAVMVNGQIISQDIDLGTLISLIVEVIKENLKGFTFALPLF